MSEPNLPKDEDYEKLKKRRLDVVSHETDHGDEPDASVLESDGAVMDAPLVPPAILKDRIVQAMKTVYDPEIPVNIYDLGLIYELDVSESGDVLVRMTLTAPGCPVAGSLVQEVHDRVRETLGVRHAKTELVWDPPWTQDNLSFEARLELGLV